MKHKDDSLEWHDENELVRRLDVVEAVLNLADTIDDVVDVIMSVPTHKVYTTTNVAMGSGGVSTTKDRKDENSSEIPNNCEHITEDGVTCAKYPACDDCLDNPLNKVKGSERLVKGSEQTEPTISKMEQVETMSCAECKHRPIGAEICEEPCHYEPQTDWHYDEQDATWYPYKHEDEPQQKSCATCKHALGNWDGESNNCGRCCGADRRFYEPKDEPQTDVYDYKGNGKWERSE